MKLILTTVDKDAEQIAETLVTEKLAACVNILPINSVYRWQDKIEKTEEKLLLIKTKDDPTETINKIKEIHPYDLPVIETINAESNAEEWIKEVCKNGQRTN